MSEGSNEACVIEVKNEGADRRFIVLISPQIMVEKYKGRIYVRPYSLKETGEVKEMKRLKVSHKFAAAMIDAFTKNELIQVHAEEFEGIIGTS